jgi:hypothetical protein
MSSRASPAGVLEKNKTSNSERLTETLHPPPTHCHGLLAGKSLHYCITALQQYKKKLPL